MAMKKVIVRGIGRRWQLQRIAEKRIIYMLHHFPDSTNFVFEQKQRDDWYEPGTLEWSVRQISKGISHMRQLYPWHKIEYWQSD